MNTTEPMSVTADVKSTADCIASLWAMPECEEQCANVIAQALMAERLATPQVDEAMVERAARAIELFGRHGSRTAARAALEAAIGGAKP